MRPPLSQRLLAVTKLVLPCRAVADIGCDHGYISIELVQSGIAQRAIAADLREGPLQMAKENLQLYGVSAKIDTRLCDGLMKIREGEVEGVVIAGMGGKLMADILKKRMDLVAGLAFLVLQPQSELAYFRHFLASEGLRIDDENLVLEDGKFYPMMRVHQGEPYTLSKVEEMYGPKLLAMHHPTLGQLLMRDKRTQEEILKKMGQQTASESMCARKAQIEDVIACIDEALEEMQNEM